MRVWRERNKKEKMVSSGHQSVGGSELRSDGSQDWIRDQGGAVIRLHFFFRSRSKRGGKEDEDSASHFIECEKLVSDPGTDTPMNGVRWMYIPFSGHHSLLV